MAKNYFKSYIWLLETLQSRGPLTLAEIKDLWMRSSVNDEEKELATRTFANHIASIADIFGIDIVCDRHTNTYRIENEEDLRGTGIRTWMLDALTLNSLLNESASMRDRIIFEDVPSSHKFLTDIIRAIRDERMLEVNYQGFTMEVPRDFLLEPYCLKEYKRRWYLFARDHNGGYKEPHSFALDRMNSVTISEKLFKVRKSFDARDFFSTRYGVLQYDDAKPAHIKIKTTAHQANYFRTLPLHSSQKEVEKTAEYSIFSYYLTPNYDFIHDLLYYGDAVEVLEPENFRAQMCDLYHKATDLYSTTNNK